jgi:hypothetical protein
MNARTRSLAGRLGVAWARVYTLGLPSNERNERRGEIISDVCEHESEAHSPQGCPPVALLDSLP